jgi:hypothetical protein
MGHRIVAEQRLGKAVVPARQPHIGAGLGNGRLLPLFSKGLITLWDMREYPCDIFLKITLRLNYEALENAVNCYLGFALQLNFPDYQCFTHDLKNSCCIYASVCVYYRQL